MFNEHPEWCAVREQAGEDHRSPDRVVSSRHDLVGLVVRLVFLQAGTSITVVEIECVDDEVATTHQLPIRQASHLARAILELTTSAKDDVTQRAASLA